MPKLPIRSRLRKPPLCVADILRWADEFHARMLGMDRKPGHSGFNESGAGFDESGGNLSPSLA